MHRKKTQVKSMKGRDEDKDQSRSFVNITALYLTAPKSLSLDWATSGAQALKAPYHNFAPIQWSLSVVKKFFKPLCFQIAHECLDDSAPELNSFMRSLALSLSSCRGKTDELHLVYKSKMNQLYTSPSQGEDFSEEFLQSRPPHQKSSEP